MPVQNSSIPVCLLLHRKKSGSKKKSPTGVLDDQARRSGDYSWTQDRRGRDSPPRAASHHPAQTTVIAQTTDFLGKIMTFEEFLGTVRDAVKNVLAEFVR